MNLRSDRPIPDGARFEPWLEPFPLAVIAILLGWVGFALAQIGHWSAWPVGVLGSGFGLFALQRGGALSRRRHEELERALEAQAVHNRELELLRGLGATLLAFRSSAELFDEVARVARHLVAADAGAVMIRSVEGEFLRIVAVDGLLRPAVDRLLPVADSFAGAALAAGEPLRSDALGTDPRNYRVEGLGVDFERAAAAPLVSRGDPIGVVAVYRQARQAPFSALDLELLATLGEQVAIGLDRAAMLDEARRNERILEETNRELIEATELKTQFLANMSHELRTPLNAIIGFADLLEGEPAFDPTHRDYLQSISRNGRHLLDLINGVLDAAKVEAGQMALRLSRLDVRPLIEGAVKDTESLRAVKQQRCDLSLPDDSMELAADHQKIRQVLLNLLSNAAKFTDHGGTVAVQVSRAMLPLPGAPGPGGTRSVDVAEAIVVSIRDTGIGIAAEDLVTLFQPFRQIDSSASRQQSGTGLGLALCKQFVELHGGTIGVESAPSRGSTFWFALPAADGQG